MRRLLAASRKELGIPDAGSLMIGIGMYLRRASAGPAVPFAVLLSLFMVILGWYMWTNAADAADAPGPHQSAEPDAGA